MKFTLQHVDKNSSARAGELITDHGKIETPIFMPVGTAGSVKGVHFKEVKDDINAQIILGNTYHLYLKPGTQIIEQAGGLHKFIGWGRPILTDSGGYQVYSLTDIRKLKEKEIPASVMHQRIDNNPVFGGTRTDLRVQAKFDEDQVSIPVHGRLTDDDIDLIIDSIKKGW